MTTWYNEIDPFAANWLRELMKAGQIATGHVEGAPIETLTEVPPGTAHFFAGIGGWDYALRLAGWPDDRPVWTGSCPCQPFSVAGKQAGGDDPRHLWPAWFRLIKLHRPDTIFGEQVAGAIGHGWLDGVFTDLETEDYTCGAVVLGAHSVGAPHIRQRLFWVADSHAERWSNVEGGERQTKQDRWQEPESFSSDRMGNCISERDENTRSGSIETTEGRMQIASQQRERIRINAWQPSDTLRCEDGRWRRTEPGVYPLAHGSATRMGRVRAHGNSIVPQVAAAFMRAYMDVEQAPPAGGGE